ncbi:MAG: nitronate monooxygenase [Deltaproteobacteria bacterium]|nr:MAG: nitronate monooxygenase [Deltaproteobacteria bacterium]
MTSRFRDHTGARVPLICGAMYPCSNRALVEAVVGAGAVAVVQPLSTVFAHREDLRETLRTAQAAARTGGGAVGLNALVEKSSQLYEDRMRGWVDIALEEGVRFFVSALGNPSWVVDKVHAVGGVVYHDVTERKWAERALDAGVDGLICVNGRAGGHAGTQPMERLFDTLQDLGVPLVAAGGVGDPDAFRSALALGYEAVQMGTRFIATEECTAHDDYKAAILHAREQDIVLTERISGVPVSVIETDWVRRTGTRAGPIARRLLRHPRAKHWVRAWYSARSVWALGRGATRDGGYNRYWQAGRSVEGIERVLPAGDIVSRFAAALDT